MENEIRITNSIKEAQGVLLIDRMPTSRELRSIGMNWLDTLISRNGGLVHWADKLGLNMKSLGSKIGQQEVERDILDLIIELNINRMPVSSEVMESRYGNKLHNNIARLGGYRYFAEVLNLPIKHSETKLGQDYEYEVIDLLREKGYLVEKNDNRSSV